ncbi:unnamed protein product [Paramecium sonneborni]|uniref:Uncharacterized protein n=1 Tax=Paramecium sonneborni TaxID=65129 RepID=A0A8S1MKA3_9CILI|nr:unnamed protein product [Paramecium sonneborni]
MNQQFQIHDIVLAPGLSIKIRNTIQFKHGQDGFHLWEVN